MRKEGVRKTFVSIYINKLGIKNILLTLVLLGFRFRFTDVYIIATTTNNIRRCVHLDVACYMDLATRQPAIIRSNYRCLLDLVD